METFAFFEYSPLYRQMTILQALSEGITKHSEIALKAGIVPSLVNKYLKSFESDGLVQKSGNKYLLTESGQIKLNYLRLSYLSEISQMYKSIELKFQDIFLKLVGKRDICIFGAGVVGTMLARLISTRQSHNIVAYLDEKAEKINTKVEGIPVMSIDTKIQVDAYIVASFKNASKMAEKLLSKGYRNVYTVDFSEGKLKLMWRG
ncbi:winged helix-turn-helix domain-containing protein [Fervidobacterium gondwanense]|uniref:Winged helix-turn-helix n=1 Tax=Fervidobacterium gondwanense DSM 13020 TaxID=1121883 RepID=A0A1M7TDW4_FERGO|nr:winged helix-turn-helix domain-containing protein [Fervidobacterium gondwanense]SHN68915.1 Winged helix-turn-helix [Fervidobacterium gondwanense DSM 13020]